MDLKTEYLGLKLDHPVVVSACQPLSKDLDKLKQMEADGAAAVVLHSLFEEQIINESTTLDHYLSYKEESFAEALTFFPEMSEYDLAPQQYLELIQRAKNELSIPLIGSLNGVSAGGWIE
ncbi:MAG: dihydroorotate dehydrogenase-like protein, partial [bacterium]